HDRFSRRFHRYADRPATTRLVDQRHAWAACTIATSFSPDELAKRSYDPLRLLELPEDFADEALAASGDTDFFTSPDGLLRLLFVEAAVDLTSYRACRAWLEELAPVLRMPSDSGAKVHLTGRPLFVSEIAGGMENDMGGTCTGTLFTVGLLFYLAHRRLLPMVYLIVSLVAILILTLAAAGFVLGSVNVISIGFAAILAGLAEDFGIVIYEEVKGHPDATVPEIRKIVAPGIFWSAVTTAGAFALLNFSSLPGLAQLGTLISTGVILAAVFMLFVFLPKLKKSAAQGKPPKVQLFLFKNTTSSRTLVAMTLVAAVGVSLLLWLKPPAFDLSPDALKPKESHASATLELIKNKFGSYRDPLWMIVTGKNEAEVQGGLVKAQQWLERQKDEGLLRDYNLPTAVWPDSSNQVANKRLLILAPPDRSLLQQQTTAFGFNPESLQLASAIFDHWAAATNQPAKVFWPTNELSHFILGKFSERSETNIFALGLVHPASGTNLNQRLLQAFPADLPKQGIQLSGWPLLGIEMFNLVWKELPMIVSLSAGLVLTSLWLTFRNVKEVLLSLLHLAFSLTALIATVSALGLKWNLMNLLAFPLLLGLIVDFSIHTLLSLRRLRDRKAVQQTTGRALLLAGATTVAGFFSLSFSSNLGLATLGLACGLGTSFGIVSAVFLLPAWWEKLCLKHPA
ncbi:MAG: MMPL family transporter, partial [Verrucomicrobiales bacterium]